MYERILVPLDGSEMSEEILPHVIELARTFGAEVLLVRATTPAYQLASESASPTAPELGLDIAKQRQSTERAAAEQYLSQVADRLGAEGIKCQSTVADGPAAAAILEQINNAQPALVAMATHGRGGLGRLFFGSVADEVVHKTSVPLFLVRSP